MVVVTHHGEVLTTGTIEWDRYLAFLKYARVEAKGYKEYLREQGLSERTVGSAAHHVLQYLLQAQAPRCLD